MLVDSSDIFRSLQITSDIFRLLLITVLLVVCHVSSRRVILDVAPAAELQDFVCKTFRICLVIRSKHTLLILHLAGNAYFVKILVQVDLGSIYIECLVFNIENPELTIYLKLEVLCSYYRLPFRATCIAFTVLLIVSILLIEDLLLCSLCICITQNDGCISRIDFSILVYIAPVLDGDIVVLIRTLRNCTGLRCCVGCCAECGKNTCSGQNCSDKLFNTLFHFFSSRMNNFVEKYNNTPVKSFIPCLFLLTFSSFDNFFSFWRNFSISISNEIQFVE